MGNKKTSIEENQEEFALMCSVCGKKAASFHKGFVNTFPVDNDHLVYFNSNGEQLWTFPASLSEKMIKFLRSQDLDKLQKFAYKEAPFAPIFDAYCPNCKAVYCKNHLKINGPYIICPKNHSRKIEP